MGKLTNKGKHKVKVGNHPHTNMISKPAIMRKEESTNAGILEMHLKLRDQQLKTILYIYRLLYQNLMGGTSLVVQLVRLRTPNAGGQASIPGQVTRSRRHDATKSPHAATKDPACHNEDPVCCK